MKYKISTRKFWKSWIMVERFTNGVMRDRNLLDIEQFNKGIIFASNVEQLTSKK